MKPTKAQEWTRNEPGLTEMHREVSRLKRRALGRKWQVIGLTLVLTGLLVGMRLRKPRSYEATVVLSMTEGAISEEDTPRPKSSLREYISDVSFNKQVLFTIIEKYDLYSSLYAIDPNLTASLMWDDLSVEVYQNQFKTGEQEDSLRRSARVSITFKAGAPETAIAVVDSLAETMVEFERRKRKATIAAASQEVDNAAKAAKMLIDQRSEKILQTERAYEKAPKSKKRPLEIELARLRLGILKAYDRLDELNIALANLEIMQGVEARGQGLVFDIVDRRDPTLHDPRPLRITIMGIAFFILALPLVGVGLAAFDTRLYNSTDVSRLGLDVLGHIPHFEDCDMASLSDREGPALH